MNHPQDVPNGQADTPVAKPIGHQSWHDLLFVHWRVPADDCQRLLPSGLTVDTWQGDAWIGLVAFHMSGVRPRWSPAIPYLSRFAETNVRTYVRCGAHEPGVWFFSLEAARLPAVLAARWGWQLNYHWSRMRVDRQEARLLYTTRRWLDPSAGAQITAEIDGVTLPAPAGTQTAKQPAGNPASPGTLDEFLVERYVFYNVGRRGRLLQGRARHRPYPLVGARLITLDETLLAVNRFDVTGPPDHVVFSPGVVVEIVGLAAL
ncbi:MAG TPA: DUF2071 domain-containing protein [Pirellulales bacterium]|jgi:hypothetical protein|nr:DUF2071 domain-containing protein [Pirellulales bacterium]